MDGALLMERFCNGDLNALRAMVRQDTKESAPQPTTDPCCSVEDSHISETETSA